MKLEYDREVDALYLKLIDSKVIDSEEIEKGIVYDYDNANRVVGIEILDVKTRTPQELKKLNFSFSKSDRSILKEFFIKEFV